VTWLEAIVLGVVQGITEFLPISSDGHLTVFQMLFERWTGQEHTGAENLFVDVMLHIGTTAAIVLYYRREVIAGIRGFVADSPDTDPMYRRSVIMYVGLLAFVACLPLAPYAFGLKGMIERALKSPTVTGLGFLVTAAMLALSSRLRGGTKGPLETSWTDALWIGIAQAFAPLPGVSRSGLTITTALHFGLSRTWAVRFSLLLAVPAVMGATLKELKDVNRAMVTPDRVAQTIVATIVAGAIGYAAIAWLVRIVGAGRLWYFSVYLVILAGVVLIGLG
jgi:undecaprenyl-diphosphatase